MHVNVGVRKALALLGVVGGNRNDDKPSRGVKTKFSGAKDGNLSWSTADIWPRTFGIAPSEALLVTFTGFAAGLVTLIAQGIGGFFHKSSSCEDRKRFLWSVYSQFKGLVHLFYHSLLLLFYGVGQRLVPVLFKLLLPVFLLSYGFTLDDLPQTDGVRADPLLDVGPRASIYHLLSACEVFNRIIVSDMLESNHAEFRKWLKRDDYEKKAEKLRSKVKKFLKCDVLKRNPLEPVVLPLVDCLLSSLCLDVGCQDIKSYCGVLKNFKDLLKPGGHLLLCGVLNGVSYCVGGMKFPAVALMKEDLEMALKEAGYQIKKSVCAADG